jgi:hypothetical protein
MCTCLAATLMPGRINCASTRGRAVFSVNGRSIDYRALRTAVTVMRVTLEQGTNLEIGRREHTSICQ